MVFEHDCKVVSITNREKISSNEQNQSGVQDEHGAYAGAGFWQDLALVSEAESGFVGLGSRTSTALVIELMEYKRRIKAWKRDGSHALPDAPRCWGDKKE